MGVMFSLPIMNACMYDEHCSNDNWTKELPSLIGKDPYNQSQGHHEIKEKKRNNATKCLSKMIDNYENVELSLFQLVSEVHVWKS